MKYLLFVTLLLIPSLSRAETLGVYVDEFADLCWTQDVPGPRTLYIMCRNSSGVTGARFRIEYSSGFTGTLLSSSSPWLNVAGDPLTGATITFDNTCQFGSFTVMVLNFMFVGGSPNCSWIRTANHPLSVATGPEVSDCAFQSVAAYWEGTHVSNTAPTDCPNDIDYEEHTHHCRPYYPTVAAEGATWGAVKALYR
jgi:hypothetical protein